MFVFFRAGASTAAMPLVGGGRRRSTAVDGEFEVYLRVYSRCAAGVGSANLPNV